MGRVLALIYGAVAYGFFLGVFLYAIGFVGNFYVPKSIDSIGEFPFGQALLINALLLTIFALQHTVMARKGFKAWWTKIVPESIERSTYVIFANSALALLFWQWRPMTEIVWDFEGTPLGMILDIMFWVGWLTVLLSTFMINHFDLFGMRQVSYYFQKKEMPALEFTTRFFYSFVRHPIMLGFIIAFWSAAKMTQGHLLFAVATFGYILVALYFEEKDMVSNLGDQYRSYKKRVSMLIPMPPKKG